MICQLSVLSANSISALAGLDPAALITLAEEVREREGREAWNNVHEILARIHDLLAVIRVEQLAGIGVKPHRLPDVERLPRPGESEPKVRVVSPREAALMMGV